MQLLRLVQQRETAVWGEDRRGVPDGSHEFDPSAASPAPFMTGSPAARVLKWVAIGIGGSVVVLFVGSAMLAGMYEGATGRHVKNPFGDPLPPTPSKATPSTQPAPVPLTKPSSKAVVKPSPVPSPPTHEQKLEALRKAPQVTELGEEGELTLGEAGPVVVAVDEKAESDLAAAAAAKDKIGYVQVVSEGRAFVVPEGTGAKLLTGGGLGVSHVRLIGGEHDTQDVYIPFEELHKVTESSS